MKHIFFMLWIAAAAARAEPAGPVLVNGDFEMDGAPFCIPTGWVPFGNAKYEGKHEGNWKAQCADLYPLHEAGLYQVVTGLMPGTKYRLAAEVRAGGPQLPIRIGLATGPGLSADTIEWSSPCTSGTWTPLSVEATAAAPHLLAVLQIRNTNPKYQLLESGVFDNATLTALGPAPLPTDRPPARLPATPQSPPRSSDVYASLADLWSLAWPKPGVRTLLASSHDPNPEANADFDRAEGRVQEAGETWTVLKSIDGPGAIVRVWMTNFARDGVIRVEIDGKPVVQDRIYDHFGSRAAGTWPLAGRTSGGWMSYVPLPFTRSARVLVRNAEQKSFYWQVTYQRFDSAEGVRPFKVPLSPEDEHCLQRIRHQWAAATANPKRVLPGTQTIRHQTRLDPGETRSIWSQAGSGIVDAIHVNLPNWTDADLRQLRLRLTWDDAPSPQVAAAAGLFFGVGYQPTISRGLLVGMEPHEGGYCYFPMPFGRSARLELVNTSPHPIEQVRCTIQWAPLEASRLSPLRFHARQVTDPHAGERQLYVPLDVRGRGHFVGLTGVLACGNVKDVHFLEGDEYIWVDGEGSPSTAGTGTEDYFTCGWYFMQGPITLPPVGATEVNRPLCRISAYRLHVPDWVPFDRSFKFGLEVGDATSSPEYGHYETLAYFYLQPD